MSFYQLRGQWRYLASRPDYKKGRLGVLFRLLAWRWRCAMKKSAEIRLPKFDVSLFLPPQWRGTAKMVYVFRDGYDPGLELLTKFLEPGKTMIDVGANIGVFSVVAARRVGGQGAVVAFEPTGATFDTLERNVALNQFKNVKPMRMALSDTPGNMRLYISSDSSRNSLAQAEASQAFEEVEVRTLDSVVQNLGLARIDFIKIDAEGADELVCRGGAEVLKKFRPAVFFEQNRAAAPQLGLQGMGTAAFLATLGYEFYILRKGEIVKSNNLEDENILAIHKG